MQITTCLIALLTCFGLASAQMDNASFVKAERDREDRMWARKSGLTATQIRTIRTSTGITDTTAGYKIRSLDAASLKTRDHILLVDIRNSCTRISVLEPNASSYTEVWSLTRVPPRDWQVTTANSSQSICSGFGISANAHVTPERRIAVDIRVLSDPSVTILPVDTYLFEWTGSKYELVKDERP